MFRVDDVAFLTNSQTNTHRGVLFCSLQEWTPLPKTHIGNVDFTVQTPQNFTLPSIVPPCANEVLIYVYIKSGLNMGKDTDIEVSLWTTDGVLNYTKYLFSHIYRQDAWSYNSKNMFFPVTKQRVLHAMTSTSLNSRQYTACSLYVTGYRI